MLPAIPNERILAAAAVAVLLALAPGAGLHAKPRKKAAAAALALEKDSAATGYGKLLKGATKAPGLFTVIHNTKQNKVYFEIPDSLFGKCILLTNRVARTSDTHDFVAGQAINGPFLLRLARDGQKVYLNEVQGGGVVDPADPIAPSFRNNFAEPVFKGFKIEATNGGSVVIDVTSFFGGNERSISPVRESSPLARLFGGKDNLKGTFVADASNIVYAKAFPGNVEVESLLSFTTQPLGRPYSVVVHRSLALLPESPMPLRLHDSRVGYFSTERSVYSSGADRVTRQAVIHRWRLEPDSADLGRYFSGELVEPRRKIVFYVDSAFPPKWRGAVKQGILDWNAAFEAAGFKGVMEARDYPSPAEDPDFDPDDMRYNCVKYAATRTPNAMGPSHVDPRTGEILNAEVIWYHNVVSLLHDWRFVQTAAVDRRVRSKVFADSLMWESMRYVASHEIGHTLGLMHNMGASFAFPVDSLRSPSFTQKYGTTPSIMDYARNNYVAQPGDPERGVRLTPPVLGVYDSYAINWGYRLIPGGGTPEQEKDTLDAWIAEKAGDPMYKFGAQQVMGTIDPTDQTEDLGDDHIKAGDYAISNLKIIMAHLGEWTRDPGQRYDGVEAMYGQVVAQYRRHLGHVLPYLGGVVFEEVRQGDGKAGRSYVGRASQRAAIKWLAGQLRTYGTWLTPKRLIANFDYAYLGDNDKIASGVVRAMLSGGVLCRVKEGGIYDPAANYTPEAYLDDVRRELFMPAYQGRRLTDADRRIMAEAISVMAGACGVDRKKAAPKAAASDDGAADGFTRINFGLPTLPDTEYAVLMHSCMRQVMRLFRQRAASATGADRSFYEYELLLMQSALTK